MSLSSVKREKILQTLEVIRKAITYMQNEIYGPNPTHTLSEAILAECTNGEELCAFWAAIGECDANKAYMKTKCAPSCQTCEMIDINARCPPLGDDAKPGLLPGGLNAMFERILEKAPGNQTENDFQIQEGMTNYTVHVHSRPGPYENGEDVVSKLREDIQPPWLITFDNFISVSLNAFYFHFVIFQTVFLIKPIPTPYAGRGLQTHHRSWLQK